MWCEGRGNWNDDEMLEVGNKGLTIAEQRTHFALCTMTQLRPTPAYTRRVMLPVASRLLVAVALCCLPLVAWWWLSARLVCQGAW